MEKSELERKTESSAGRELHAKAEYEREHGSFAEALKLTDEALIKYQKDGDYLGMAEVLSSRMITFRHLSRENGDKTYLLLAKKTGEAAIEIAKKTDRSASALPLYNLAQVYEELGDFEPALESYRTALSVIRTNPPERHKHPAVEANFELHLETCAYKNGDKSALQRAEIALGMLRGANFPDKYVSDVWISGGHIRIAEAVSKDDSAKAKEHLGKAKKIIDANPQLTLRRAQLEELSVKIL